MEAPEKIYLSENPITEEPDDKWLSKRSDENDIEYIRTDAFIEKACSWLKSKGGFIIGFPGAEIKDFKNYMKGE